MNLKKKKITGVFTLYLFTDSLGPKFLKPIIRIIAGYTEIPSASLQRQQTALENAGSQSHCLRVSS